jgi:uncharacterized HhH-GPD family protein
MGGLDRMIENRSEGKPFSGNAEADAFLSRVVEGPVLGALFDQQMRAELAFIGAFRLSQRIGGLDMAQIAAMEPAAFSEAFRRPPGIHRFGQMMAERTQELATHIVKHHSGDVATLWADGPSDAELHTRFEKLPGFGPSKAGVLISALELFGHRARKSE